MKNFLLRNGFNLATMVLAIVALYFAYQSNQIADRTNQIVLEQGAPKILVLHDTGFLDLAIYVTACHDVGLAETRIRRFVRDRITIVNNGGRAASVLNVLFSDGLQTFTDVKTYEPGGSGTLGKEELKMPLSIEPGKAYNLEIQAQYDSLGDREKGLATTISYLLESRAKIMREVYWMFTISDGTRIAKDYKDARYAILHDINAAILDNCEE